MICKSFFFFNSDSESDGCETICPSGVPYKGDVTTPVFSWSKSAFSSQDIVKILLASYEPEYLCVSPPVNVENNASFLVDCSKLANKDDIKCDDMGAWSHKGSPKRFFVIKKTKDNKISKVVTLRGKCQTKDEGIYMLRRTYSENASDSTVRKQVSKLTG